MRQVIYSCMEFSRAFSAVQNIRFLQKMITTLLITKFPSFRDTGSSLPYAKNTAPGTCSDPAEPIHTYTRYIFNTSCNIIVPHIGLLYSTKISHVFLNSLVQAACSTHLMFLNWEPLKEHMLKRTINETSKYLILLVVLLVVHISQYSPDRTRLRF